MNAIIVFSLLVRAFRGEHSLHTHGYLSLNRIAFANVSKNIRDIFAKNVYYVTSTMADGSSNHELLTPLSGATTAIRPFTICPAVAVGEPK